MAEVKTSTLSRLGELCDHGNNENMRSTNDRGHANKKTTTLTVGLHVLLTHPSTLISFLRTPFLSIQLYVQMREKTLFLLSSF